MLSGMWLIVCVTTEVAAKPRRTRLAKLTSISLVLLESCGITDYVGMYKKSVACTKLARLWQSPIRSELELLT